MDIHALAQMRVPRYTSYPTAVAFDDAIGPHDYRQWLSSIADHTSVSIYIHIPFCRALCHYCGCHMSVTQRSEPVVKYVDDLITEIRLLGQHISSRLPMRHLHFGGGTPSILPPAQLDRLMVALSGVFDVTVEGERAMELDPRTVSPDLASALAYHGFNRVSLGVQDLEASVQRAINRDQPLSTVHYAADLLRGAGISALNIDLMYGLPLQTADSIRKTVHKIAAMAPDRLAVFGYAHVPWMKKHQQVLEQYGLPDAQERFDQATALHSCLTGRGYVPIGLDHYATETDSLTQALRSGRLRRNFQGYTDDPVSVLIGLGASSIGTLPQGFVQNVSRTDDYAHRCQSSQLPTVRGYALTQSDQLIAAAIEHLMCYLSVDLEAIADEFGASVQDVFGGVQAVADHLVDLGVLQREGWCLTVPESARLFARIAAAAVDPRVDWSILGQENQIAPLKHSTAI